jgi:hypothetical protein
MLWSSSASLSARWNLQRLNELDVCLDPGEPAYGYTTVYAGPAHGDFARFQPGGGLGMGFDDLKTIEAGRFLESVLRGRQLAPSVDDGLATAVVLNAAERSAATEGWVDVWPVGVPGSARREKSVSTAEKGDA